MSRKKAETDSESIAESEKRPVNVKLSPAFHKLLRMLAADAEMSMGQYAATILIDGINAKASKIGID